MVFELYGIWCSLLYMVLYRRSLIDGRMYVVVQIRWFMLALCCVLYIWSSMYGMTMFGLLYMVVYI